MSERAPGTAFVLVVEDDPDLLDTVEVLLETAGFSVETARNGAEAIDRLRSDPPPSLILLDLMMPVMSGYELLERMREEAVAPDVPVVVLSALGHPAEAPIAGAAASLPKPFKAGELLETVTAYVRPARVRKKANGRANPDERLGDPLQLAAQIIESSLDGVFAFDRDLHIAVWNPAMERLTSLPASAMLGRSALENLPVQMDGGIERFYRDALAGRSGIADCIHYENPDKGRTGVGEARFAPLRNADGEIIGGVAVVRDVTEQHLAVQALRDSEARFRSFFEGAVIGMARIDFNGVVLDGNQTLARMLGYEVEELAGRPFTSFLHPEDVEANSFLLEQMRAGALDYFQMDNRMVRRDGRLCWTATTVMTIQNDRGDKEFGIGIVEDTTDKRVLEEQLRQSQKMEAIGRLAGGIAHDFNNMLSVIAGYSEMLLWNDTLGAEPRSQIEEIHRAGERASGLTRQLLAFSRKALVTPVVLDLRQAITGMDRMLRRLIGADVELVTLPSWETSPVLQDPSQVEQIVMNLVVNARDAMPKGGKIVISTKNVELGDAYCRLHPDARPGPYVLLAVSDTGIGMDEETRLRVFEPFFTTKGRESGTGLGLSTVYGIVQQGGGHITVESKPGQGTTFYIYFPRLESVLEHAGEPAAMPRLPQGSQTVLIAEDESMVRVLTREILNTCGYHVLDAMNGEEAVRLAAAYDGPIHLLLADVVMPQMGGREAADNIQALRPGIKVLFMSGYTDDAIIRHGAPAPDAAFIAKPFSPYTLAARVGEMLQ